MDPQTPPANPEGHLPREGEKRAVCQACPRAPPVTVMICVEKVVWLAILGGRPASHVPLMISLQGKSSEEPTQQI